ncbi:MarR family winged helix-turn-helix transcriptional regulator [Winogradskya humida]|uniref:HTH marR-type domain-containing protein n=1 Tax=Winogradskya humida TaxID=113566 RepID=A0ABQ3ZLE7_9ACTN|nr:MarR family transcriptional regulator [Actinoplanes humidus]GIE19347.1 hypothetical protein Ahu01nite_024490 [Actinoplanes humidus]
MEELAHDCAADADGPVEDLATGLIQLTRLIRGIYRRTAERHNLTPVQAKLLCGLLDGPRGMAALAQTFGVEKAALTGLMDRTEKLGLAQRSPVPGDRRALQATLTDAGRAAARAFNADVTAEMGKLTEHLGPDTSEQLRTTVTDILERHRAHSA